MTPPERTPAGSRRTPHARTFDPVPDPCRRIRHRLHEGQLRWRVSGGTGHRWAVASPVARAVLGLVARRPVGYPARKDVPHIRIPTPDYAPSSSCSIDRVDCAVRSVQRPPNRSEWAARHHVCGQNSVPAPVWSLEHEVVESGAGAPTLGSGGDSGAFVPGLSPAPIVTFPAPALRTRRADFRHRALQWDHAPRTRTARAIWACRWSADAARLPLCIPTPSPARRRACSRLDNIEPVRFDSLTYACDASGIIALIAGSRHRHSRRPSSFRHRSTPEVPFLDRHYPASSVVRTSPPPRPAQPAPHGVPVGACHTTDRASRVAPFPLFHACRRQYPGGTSRCACRSLPGQWQPSPTYGRVGSRIPGFEACSAFTRVAARMVAGSPKATRSTEVLRTMSLPPSSAPIATGWSDSLPGGIRTR